jgi:hypothetical protein
MTLGLFYLLRMISDTCANFSGVKDALQSARLMLGKNSQKSVCVSFLLLTICKYPPPHHIPVRGTHEEHIGNTLVFLCCIITTHTDFAQFLLSGVMVRRFGRLE